MFPRISQFNAFMMFGILPWVVLVLPSVISYVVLAGLLLLNKRFVPVLVLVVAAGVAYFTVEHSPVRIILTEIQTLSAYNATFAMFLISALPFLRSGVPLEASKATDISLALFLPVILLLQLTGTTAFYALLQIMAYSYACYFIFADQKYRKSLVLAYLLVSGARAIVAGFIMAFVWTRYKSLRSTFTGPLFLGVNAVVLSGSLFALLYEHLMELRDQSIFMKGRTNFWLGILESDPGLFGNGPGSSLLVIETVIRGEFLLPHNEWLRIYSDFGLAGLIFALVVLFQLSRRNFTSRFATVVLAAYMTTGNPLSFPTVIATYYLLCLSISPQGSLARGAIPSPRRKTIGMSRKISMPGRLAVPTHD